MSEVIENILTKSQVVDSQLSRIETNISDAYSVVAQRGGVLPPVLDSNNLPSAIMSIQTEGEYRPEGEMFLEMVRGNLDGINLAEPPEQYPYGPEHINYQQDGHLFNYGKGIYFTKITGCWFLFSYDNCETWYVLDIGSAFTNNPVLQPYGDKLFLKFTATTTTTGPGLSDLFNPGMGMGGGTTVTVNTVYIYETEDLEEGNLVASGATAQYPYAIQEGNKIIKRNTGNGNSVPISEDNGETGYNRVTGGQMNYNVYLLNGLYVVVCSTSGSSPTYSIRSSLNSFDGFASPTFPAAIDVIYGNGVWLAYNGADIMVTNNGKVWNIIPKVDGVISIQGVFFLQGKFVALMKKTYQTGNAFIEIATQIMTSIDGENGEFQTNDGLVQYMKCIKIDDTLYIGPNLTQTLSDSGLLSTVDGLNWIRQKQIPSCGVYGIIKGNNNTYSVNYYYDTNSTLYYKIQRLKQLTPPSEE